MQFVAIFLAMAAASELVAQDLERGTGLFSMSKPLRRSQMLLGKTRGGDVFLPTFLGFAASMVASWLVVAFCLVLSRWMPAVIAADPWP